MKRAGEDGAGARSEHFAGPHIDWFGHYRLGRTSSSCHARLREELEDAAPPATRPDKPHPAKTSDEIAVFAPNIEEPEGPARANLSATSRPARCAFLRRTRSGRGRQKSWRRHCSRRALSPRFRSVGAWPPMVTQLGVAVGWQHERPLRCYGLAECKGGLTCVIRLYTPSSLRFQRHQRQRRGLGYGTGLNRHAVEQLAWNECNARCSPILYTIRSGRRPDRRFFAVAELRSQQLPVRLRGRRRRPPPAVHPDHRHGAPRQLARL